MRTTGYVQASGCTVTAAPVGWLVIQPPSKPEPPSAADRRIWPCGRYEVYLEEERLNGFHTLDDAVECAAQYRDLGERVVLDRATRFSW